MEASQLEAGIRGDPDRPHTGTRATRERLHRTLDRQHPPRVPRSDADPQPPPPGTSPAGLRPPPQQPPPAPLTQPAATRSTRTSIDARYDLGHVRRRDVLGGLIHEYRLPRDHPELGFRHPHARGLPRMLHEHARASSRRRRDAGSAMLRRRRGGADIRPFARAADGVTCAAQRPGSRAVAPRGAGPFAVDATRSERAGDILSPKPVPTASPRRPRPDRQRK